jgi:4-hydroxy-tetrahydrodipicolinate reductase
MVRLLVNGANGKMGTVLISQAQNDPELCVVAGVDTIKGANGSIIIYDNPFDIHEEVDCIIDFSVPKATIKILDYAVKKKIPIVIATTGHTEEQLNYITKCSNIIPIFKSSNMSYSINLLLGLINTLGKALYENYDIEILEKHHNRKADSPSGTALLIANSIKNFIADDKISINPHRTGKRVEKEIGISSIRGGNVVGEHSVFFLGDNESIEIKHTCNSRAIFADGALLAAKFIITKPNGIYCMIDII